MRALLDVTYRTGHSGCRVWVTGLRVHHGLAGTLTAAYAVRARRPALLALAALAVWHDRRDFPFWLTDRHPLSLPRPTGRALQPAT